jgi:hypothetical protein
MKWRVFLVCSVLAIVGILGFSLTATADTIVRGFKAKTTLQPGLIVALSKDKSDTVEAVPSSDAARTYGVVIDPSQAPVTVQMQGQQVFVATAGNYPVLVSTQKGKIKPGDYISISTISGIGAKASDQPVVLGQALESFDGQNGVITQDSDGSVIGRVNVSIIPGKNPLIKNSAAVPAPLKRFGEAIAGKNVTASRIYAAIVVFVISAIIALCVLWIGVRSSIISIGRNPLSHKSIMRGLLQVVIVAVSVFIIGVFGVYLLLKL